MKRARAAFLDYLKHRGLKVTQQRLTILDAVFKTHEHFSAEALHRRLRNEGVEVSLATVYRTVNVLVEGGFLEALDVGGGQLLFEHVMGHGHHDHLVCLGCNKIQEFRCPEIEKLQEREAAKLNFRVTHHSLRLFGYCAACERRGKAHESTSNSGRLAASQKPPH